MSKTVGKIAWYRVATNLQFVKNTASAKCNKVKCNKTRYGCIVPREKYSLQRNNRFDSHLMRNDGSQKTINVQKESNWKTRTLYSTKIPFKNEFEIKIFPDTQKQKICYQETHIKGNSKNVSWEVNKWSQMKTGSYKKEWRPKGKVSMWVKKINDW